MQGLSARHNNYCYIAHLSVIAPLLILALEIDFLGQRRRAEWACLISKMHPTLRFGIPGDFEDMEMDGFVLIITFP